MNTINRTSPSIFTRVYPVWTALRRRRLFWAGTVVCPVSFLFLMTPVILNWTMVYDTPVHPAEVIFIGVGLGNALDVVIDLQKSGMVKQIVVVYGKERLIEKDGKPVALHELTVQQLIHRGVPQDAVKLAQWDAEDKVERQLLFREWLLKNKIQSYLAFVSA